MGDATEAGSGVRAQRPISQRALNYVDSTHHDPLAYSLQWFIEHVLLRQDKKLGAWPFFLVLVLPALPVIVTVYLNTDRYAGPDWLPEAAVVASLVGGYMVLITGLIVLIRMVGLFRMTKRSVAWWVDLVIDRDKQSEVGIEVTLKQFAVEMEAWRPSRGGRPPNPVNEWAWEQVHVLGRPMSEVYPEWYERRTKDEDVWLADPEDSFKKAIGSRRRKKQGTNVWVRD